MTSTSKKINYKKKNLQMIPLNMPSSDLITEIDLSYNPITSFQNLPYLENLKTLIIDSTKISTFWCAPYLPNLENFMCRNTPLGASSHVGLMSAIVLSDKLKQVNNVPLDDRKMKIANYYREQYRDIFIDGYLIINLSPIRIFNPDTRKRQTIFGDFSKVPKTSAVSTSKVPKSSKVSALSSSSKMPRSSHIINQNSSSIQHPPVKQKNRKNTTETTKTTKTVTTKTIATKTVTNKSSSTKSSVISHSPKSKHVESVVEVFDDTENDDLKGPVVVEDDEDQQLKNKYLAFTKHILKQTVKQRRDMRNGIVHRKTPLQLEIESSQKASDSSDDEFYGKKDKSRKESELMKEEVFNHEEEVPEQEQYEEEVPEQEQYKEEVPEQEQYEEEVPEQDQYEEEVPEQEQLKEEVPEQEQYKAEDSIQEQEQIQNQFEVSPQDQNHDEVSSQEQNPFEVSSQDHNQNHDEVSSQEQNPFEVSSLDQSQCQDEYSTRSHSQNQLNHYSDIQYSELQYSDQEHQEAAEKAKNSAPKDQDNVSDYGYYSDDEPMTNASLQNSNNVPNSNVPANNVQNNNIPASNVPNNANQDQQNKTNVEYDDYYSEDEYDEVKL